VAIFFRVNACRNTCGRIVSVPERLCPGCICAEPARIPAGVSLESTGAMLRWQSWKTRLRN